MKNNILRVIIDAKSSQCSGPSFDVFGIINVNDIKSNLLLYDINAVYNSR